MRLHIACNLRRAQGEFFCFQRTTCLRHIPANGGGASSHLPVPVEEVEGWQICAGDEHVKHDNLDKHMASRIQLMVACHASARLAPKDLQMLITHNQAIKLVPWSLTLTSVCGALCGLRR